MFNEKNKAEELLRKGFNKSLSLQRGVFLLAKYYKYLNYSETECILCINEWLDIYKKHISYKQTVEKLDAIIRRVYDSNYNFTYKVFAKIYLEEMKKINYLETKGERKIAFCLLYLSKILHKDDNGIFSCTYDMLEKLSGMHENQIIIIITKLNNTPLLDIVSRNVHKKTFNFDKKDILKGKIVYKYPNRYKINFPKGKKLLQIIKDVESLEEDFIKIYRVCLDEYKFKSSVKFKRYIRRHKIEGDI